MRPWLALTALLCSCSGFPEPASPLPVEAEGSPIVKPQGQPPSRIPGRLTLDDALGLADRVHPDLALGRSKVEAAEGRILQAGRFPNPNLVGLIEGATLDDRPTVDSAIIAGVSQRIPVGGRLGAAAEAERLEGDRVARELAVRRLEIQSRVRGAFATALFAAEAARLQAETLELSRRALAVTRARRDAGDAAEDELARSEMEEVRARLEEDKAHGLRDLAYVALAAAVGNPGLRIEGVEGSLETALELPTLESVLASLDGGPHAALARADVDAARARIDLAKVERIPDVMLDLFYRRIEISNRNSVDLGITVPLPLFDRNQGRIREAEAERRGAEARARSTRDEAVRRVREAHVKLTEAIRHVRLVQDELLPRSALVLKAAEARYGAGDLSLADVIPIRREAAAVRLSYLEGLREAMEAWGALRLFLKP